MALTIQERLKDLRVEHGLTLEQLAEQTNLSKSALGSYEADDFKDISHSVLIKLAKSYGVTTDYLLGLSEMPVVLVPIDSVRGKGFEVPVVVLNSSLVYDDLPAHHHILANIPLRIQLKSAGDGDVGIDWDRTFQKAGGEQLTGELTRMLLRPGDEPGLLHAPFRQVGGEGGLAGAGDSEVDVENMGRIFRLEPADQNDQDNQVNHM